SRVPSPWDVVLSSSAPLDKMHHQEEPKLAAEVEEGNVEYKLHLINPSHTRFVRLVTQMKWRLLEGGGQAIYELGVADSAEIGARVIIAKEIEVVGSSDTSLAAAGFRSPTHKQNGSKDNQRTAVKNMSRFQTLLADPDSSPRSFASAASMTTSSSGDSTSSTTTDPHFPLPLSSPPSPLLTDSIETHETVHDDDSLFPMLTLDEPHHSARGLADGNELLINPSQAGAITIPKIPIIRIQGGHSAPRLRDVQHRLEVHSDGLQESDESLLAAFGKLEVADSPEEGKRIIVEAMVIRELDQEEGFLDFDSF
ncbi:hypothetical protein EI94DRAFT_1736217, partial [Lactarius quietus]